MENVIFQVVEKYSFQNRWWIRLKDESAPGTTGIQVIVKKEEFESIKIGSRYTFKKLNFYA